MIARKKIGGFENILSVKDENKKNFLDSVNSDKSWLVFYLLREYSLLNPQYPVIFQGNSANALFAILNCMRGGKHVALAFKIQTNENADDLLIDSINGRILRTIQGESEDYQYKGIMRYVNSFLLKTSQASKNVNESLYYTLFTSYATHTISYKCFVSEAVNSLVTLERMLCCQDPYVFMEVYMRYLPKLVLDFIALGENVGFVHNDCHLGNIMFDIKNNCLVLIDFGRVQMVVEKELNKSTAEECENLNREYNTYTDLMYANLSKQQSKGKAIYVCPFYSDASVFFKTYAYIFDISTIVLNMRTTICRHIYSKISRQIRHKSLEEITWNNIDKNETQQFGLNMITLGFHDFIKMALLYNRNVVIAVRKPCYLQAQYINRLKSTNLTNKLNIGGHINFLGIFVFSMFIHYLVSVFKLKDIDQFIKTDSDCYIVDMNKLSDTSKIMYKCYQYKVIPEVKTFVSYLNGYEDFIKDIVIFIKGFNANFTYDEFTPYVNEFVLELANIENAKARDKMNEKLRDLNVLLASEAKRQSIIAMHSQMVANYFCMLSRNMMLPIAPLDLNRDVAEVHNELNKRQCVRDQDIEPVEKKKKGGTPQLMPALQRRCCIRPIRATTMGKRMTLRQYFRGLICQALEPLEISQKNDSIPPPGSPFRKYFCQKLSRD